MYDLQNAYRASRNGTTVIADDCSSRYPAVVKAFGIMEKQGLLERRIADEVHHMRQAYWSPSQKDIPTNGSAFKKSDRVIGLKGWCVGTFVKPVSWR